jgi:GNAT superfamily N-acetyltransferase
VELLTYDPTHKAACLAIFDANTPAFFAPHERAEFVEFLDNDADPYFVVADAGAVVACGGYFVIPTTPAAVLTWGMVDWARHRQGIGWFLLLARLQRLCHEPRIKVVKLQTSQHSAGFFERAGFAVQTITEDGYAPGMHQYNMGLVLDESRRQIIAEQYRTICANDNSTIPSRNRT